MQLFPHQDQALEWLKNRPKAYLALDQGLGKTAIAARDCQGKTLVVCPASLKLNWQREFEMWRPELETNVVNKATDGWSDHQVQIINYDILHKVKSTKFDTVIFDEAHYLKSHTAIRTKQSIKYIKTSPRIRLLSGTPLLNRPVEIWPTLFAIGGTKLDYLNFAKRYCGAWQPPWLPPGAWDVSGASNTEELSQLLEPLMLRMKKADVLDLPEKSFQLIELDLPVTKEEKTLSLDWIEKPESPVPFEALSIILRMHGERKVPLSSEYICNLLESVDKVVVFAHHKVVIEELKNKLKKYSPVVVTGSVSGQARQDAVDKFQKDKKCRVFIGNLAAASVGLTLTAASDVVFVESSWSPATMEQAIDRCHRIGQRSPVTGHVLTISNSVDSQVLRRVLLKGQVIDQIINRLNSGKK